MKNIEDIYKHIGSQLNDSIDSSWDKIELNIECSDKYIGTNAKYQINGEWKNALNLALNRETKIDLIKFHNSAKELHFAQWNKAIYTLEKNGHFDMTFEWDQALQDEWDKI